MGGGATFYDTLVRWPRSRPPDGPGHLLRCLHGGDPGAVPAPAGPPLLPLSRCSSSSRFDISAARGIGGRGSTSAPAWRLACRDARPRHAAPGGEVRARPPALRASEVDADMLYATASSPPAPFLSSRPGGAAGGDERPRARPGPEASRVTPCWPGPGSPATSSARARCRPWRRSPRTSCGAWARAPRRCRAASRSAWRRSWRRCASGCGWRPIPSGPSGR